ncbi:hypothetical protein M758_UG214900 [Ceratodon purpureus]|jgi:hypothetical protein|nr:hypothetical protein M758_UG214900 [Ceratodon purpureus]
MRFGVDYGSFETDEDHAKDITTPYGYDHMVGYFDEHSSHSVAHITMWHPVFVNIIDNPCHGLHSQETASDILEEGGDDVKSAWPLWAGLHTCYNGNYNRKQGFKAERIQKDSLSSDCSLQLENMKSESLVIADQHAAVNMYSGPVHTARHTMGIGFARSIKPRITHYFSVLRRW